MFRSYLLACVAILAISGAFAAAQDDISSPKLRMLWAEFKTLYDAHELVVIDVRNGISYEAGHIPGARHIPYNEIDKHVAELKRIRQPIVLYCA